MAALDTVVSGRLARVPRLSEAEAVEQGSEILSELIIVSIAVSCLVIEYSKVKADKLAEETEEKKEMDQIREALLKIETNIKEENEVIRALVAHLLSRTKCDDSGASSYPSIAVDLRKMLQELPPPSKKVEKREGEIKTLNEVTEDKSLSDEFVEFVEEVFEEILDAVNPDDED